MPTSRRSLLSKRNRKELDSPPIDCLCFPPFDLEEEGGEKNPHPQKTTNKKPLPPPSGRPQPAPHLPDVRLVRPRPQLPGRSLLR